MKIAIAVVLLVAAAQAAVQPRSIEIPESQLFPSHTAAEWRAIYAAAEDVTPEFVADYKPGTEPQIDGAGAMRGDVKVIQGSNAVSGQFPWQASVTMDSSYFCGGSIISSTWILTAGHCVSGITSFRVVLGSLTPDGGASGSVAVTSRTKILHSGYSGILIANDIGLVQLPSALSWSTTIGPVRLPGSSLINVDLTGRTTVISGWGRTSDASNGIASTLQTARLRVISNTECAQTFGSSVRAGNICTSGQEGPATCNGDSGGPLVLQESDGLYTEVGIVSYGSSAGCEKGYPDAFTRVTSYLSWIETNTGITIRRQ